MTTPVIPDGTEITVVHWLVGGVGGLFGAMVSALIFIWHAASKATEMKKDIAQATTDIADIRKRADEHGIDVAALRRIGDQRHEENLRAIGHISSVVAALPDKRDFQRLEDQVRQSFGELKQAIAQTR